MFKVAEQLIILFSFMIIGYIVRKKNIVNDSAAQTLSNLLVYVFAPAVTLNNLSTNLNIDNLNTKAIYLIVSAVVLIFAITIGKFLPKFFSKDRYERNVYSYNFTTGNFGYLGYALVQGLYGEEMLLNMIIFGIPMTVYIYTEGLRILTDRKEMDFKKLINPALIAILIGAIVGLCGIKLPGTAVGILKSAGGCMAPASMLITGFALAEYGLMPLFKKFKNYIASIMRLIVIPVALLIVFSLFNVDKNVSLITVLFYSLPAGMNSVVFPKMLNKDCQTGLSMVMISNILCIITIPVIVWLVQTFV